MSSGRPLRIAGAVVLAALAGCEGIERQGPPAAEPSVVRLQQDSIVLALDLAERLAVTRTDTEGNALPGRFQWRSGDKSVAIVDSGGIVTAVGLGRTWIEVSDTRHADTAIVNTFLQLKAIHAGADVTCALTIGGAAVCWGMNTFGSLGDGRNLDRGEPALVDGAHRFRMLSVGTGSVCGLEAIGTLLCWGYNGVGQLGDGTTGDRSRPVTVADTLQFGTIVLGAGTTTCAFERSTMFNPLRGAQPSPASGGGERMLLCWGWNAFGQMLDGGGVNPHKPMHVDAGRALDIIATGGHHLCGLDTARAAWCWGRNDEGQLGDGTGADRTVPVAVADGHAFALLVTGIAHSCGLDIAGQVWCWGSNLRGQLGVASSGGSPVPLLAAGGMAFDTLVTSAHHSCGLRGGAAWCWGSNTARQLGGSTTGSQPAPVAGGRQFRSISAGWNHTCGIATDGFAYCWGGNLHGALGAPTAPDGFSPVRVSRQQ